MATTAEDPDIGGDAATAGQSVDPVAREGKALAQAGGPRAGEPAAGGTGYGSGEDRRDAAPPRPRPEARAGTPASNTVAPLVHTAMDDDLAATEDGSGRLRT